MSDFTSSFWSLFITVLVVISIAGCFWLNWANTEQKKGTQPETMKHVWDGDLREYNNPLPRWWLMLFYGTLVFSVVYLALYPGLGSYAGILGWSEKGQYDQEVADASKKYGPLYDKYLKEDLAALAKNPEALKTGERLFANNCSVCHGSDGRGAPGFPNLRDHDWNWGGDPALIKTSIMEGRNGMMPAKGGVELSDADIDNLTHHVLSLSGKKADDAKAAAGKEKFTVCAACHGPEGKGNPALGAPNLTDNVWLHGGSEKTIKETITKGRLGVMPAHKLFLGEAKSHVLAAYVLSLSQQPAK